MTTITRTLRTVALSLALAAGGAAATHHAAHACGGYQMTITEPQRVQWALAAFLGELGQRVSYGTATIKGGTHAALMIESDAARGRRRVKVRQTFRLEKRDGVWKVVDWSSPVVAAPPMVARR